MSALPKTAFIDPTGKNRAAVEALLHQAVALLVEEMTQAQQRSPLPEAIASQQFTQWAKIPEQSVDATVLLDEVRSHLTGSMNAAHPGYIGHMDSIPTTLSIVGDLLVGALNNNMLSVEMSPVFSRLEPQVLKQIAARFGLGPDSGGVLVSGGSLANLQALTVARNQAFDALENGVVSLEKQPVFFVSEVAHTSMKKAAMMMGLGTKAAIALRTNANSQVEIADLEAKLAQAEVNGQQPFAIVATAGTTVTGNVDPIAEMAAIAQARQLWFHVDAAYGGAVIFSETHRSLLSGIQHADSITFNPQKWLYVTKTCATILFKQFDVLKQHFRILAPYMNDDAQWPNIGELTVQGTRHPDILKLWLSLQHLGTAGYREIIHGSYKLTSQFVAAVQARPYLQLASQPQMNVVCFRLAPADTDVARQDQLNAKLQHYLLTAELLTAELATAELATDAGTLFGKQVDESFSSDRDAVFLSLPIYRHRRWLKAVLLNPYTQPATIEALFRKVDAFVTTISVANLSVKNNS
ncbi:MAG: aminotransferase class I/II-fold pyridoxal phosphate-dependent enzyme [Phormidesmis sp.]